MFINFICIIIIMVVDIYYYYYLFILLFCFYDLRIICDAIIMICMFVYNVIILIMFMNIIIVI